MTPVVLHTNLSHLLGNLISQIIIGAPLEQSIGTFKFLIFYFVCGIGGVLFSALCSDTISCGASTAIYGLIGSYISFLIVNWNFLKDHQDKKCQLLIFIATSLLVTLLVSITGT